MDGGEEGFAVFGVSCGDAAPALEMQEGIFDPMAEFVEILIVTMGYCPKKDFRWLRKYSGHLVGQQGSGGAILQTAMEPLFIIPALKG